MELVSVIIPAYNRGHIIPQAIRSVLEQTYQDLELLIVDDGSTDQTDRVVAALAINDQRIRYLSHDANKGAQAARNTGIYAARGAWIAFLDSDDQYLPYSLECRLQAAYNEQVYVVHSDCQILASDGSMTTGRELVHKIPELFGNIYHALLQNPGPFFPSLFIKKEALKRIGYLDESVPSYQEWETAIRLAEFYPFAFVVRPTFLYNRRGQDAMSQNLLLHAVGYEYIVRKHRSVILEQVGHKVLARHYRRIASLYEETGNSRGARRYYVLAIRHSPILLISIFRRLYRNTLLKAYS